MYSRTNQERRSEGVFKVKEESTGNKTYTFQSILLHPSEHLRLALFPFGPLAKHTLVSMDIEQSASPSGPSAPKAVGGKDTLHSNPSLTDDHSPVYHEENELLGGQIIDRALAAKMGLVNDVSLGKLHSTSDSNWNR